MKDAVKDRKIEEKQQCIAKYNIKDLDVVDKILLVGPSSDIKKYNAEFLNNRRMKDITSYHTSGSIEHFKNINTLLIFGRLVIQPLGTKEFVCGTDIVG